MKHGKTANERLIDYIMNLTPEQADKLVAQLSLLKRAANIDGLAFDTCEVKAS